MQMGSVNLLRFISTRFPIIVSLKRFVFALRDSVLPAKDSYSQYGEDKFLLNELGDTDLSESIYVDVGANQPTCISNTYLFYRKGHCGVTVEPNPQMKTLHRLFRPRDKFVNVGCGSQAGMFEFRHASGSVLSGFTSETQDYVRTEFIPVLTLDTILNTVDRRPIFLLSIDTEGMDLAVIQGATEVLSRTDFLLVEDNNADPVLRVSIEEQGFQYIKNFYHNLLFRRQPA